MNTCLTNTLTGGGRSTEAVEAAAERNRMACACRLKAREDKIRNLALIQNGKHPKYQKTKHQN